MEVLLMAVVLHALCLHQGLQCAAISSKENGTNISRSDELVEKQSGPHTPSVDCPGTLLALRHGSWVPVNLTHQSTETNKDMAQLCNDLGCGERFAANGTLSRNTCLSDCTIINSTLYNCTEAAPDHCSNVTDVACAWQVVQLTGGEDKCVGRVELFGTGGWGTVCDDGWDLKGGNVVCAQLGCGTAVNIHRNFTGVKPGSGPIHFSQLKCTGTEKNLWECAIVLDRGRNYCGHKEDAAVLCSESSYYIPVTTVNALMPNLTNATTETVANVADEANSGRISPAVLGCIFLSVTLLLLLFSNAAQCVYYKRRNGGFEDRRASQPFHRDNSETSSDSDYERYYNPDSAPPTIVNTNEHNDNHWVGNCNQEQGRICEERNAMQSVNQFYPEHSIQMTPFHNSSEPTKKTLDSFDSDSTSSGECYENPVNTEPFFQTMEEDPSLPEQVPVSHAKPQTAGNSSVSQSYSPDQVPALDSESTSSGEWYENTQTETENLLNPAVNQVYYSVQMPPFPNPSEPAKKHSDSFDSDSTSSGECYENIEVNAEPCLQTYPSLPEQVPLSHPKPQTVGNYGVSQSYSPDQDDSSTSSEEAYVNVAEIEEDCFARREPSVHSSSDSDYDDVSNW